MTSDYDNTGLSVFRLVRVFRVRVIDVHDTPPHMLHVNCALSGGATDWFLREAEHASAGPLHTDY